MYNKFLILIYGYFILVWFGMIIKYILQYMGVNESKVEGIKNGGFVIGLLERILIFSFVLTKPIRSNSLHIRCKVTCKIQRIGEKRYCRILFTGNFYKHNICGCFRDIFCNFIWLHIIFYI